jgi:hypothetical protein
MAMVTISFKVSEDLLFILKKAAKIRGITMSQLIRIALENTLAESSTGKKSLIS